MATKSIEVKVLSNPKHKGIVDLKVVAQDARGAIGANGIRWVGVK